MQLKPNLVDSLIYHVAMKTWYIHNLEKNDIVGVTWHVMTYGYRDDQIFSSRKI